MAMALRPVVCLSLLTVEAKRLKAGPSCTRAHPPPPSHARHCPPYIEHRRQVKPRC